MGQGVERAGPPKPTPSAVIRGRGVTDVMVRSALSWARNYEEIVDFELIGSAGRKWRVTLRDSVVIGSGLWMRGEPQEAVPPVLIFTSREAMAFAYGCAVGGESKPRVERRKEWSWDD